MERGWSLENAVTTPARFHYVPNDDLGSGTAKSVTVEGKKFRTISEAAREYGLIAENVIENKKFVPVLSTIPFIGRMFQSTIIDKEQRELLIFITPNVVG